MHVNFKRRGPVSPLGIHCRLYNWFNCCVISVNHQIGADLNMYCRRSIFLEWSEFDVSQCSTLNVRGPPLGLGLEFLEITDNFCREMGETNKWTQGKVEIQPILPWQKLSFPFPVWNNWKRPCKNSNSHISNAGPLNVTHCTWNKATLIAQQQKNLPCLVTLLAYLPSLLIKYSTKNKSSVWEGWGWYLP